MPILIVEDDADSWDMMSRILRFHGIAFEIVHSAEAALERLALNPNYSGIIIDLALPSMDGWTLMGLLRNNAATAHVPCVAVTAYDNWNLNEQALEAGFAAYFAKPLERVAFTEVVQGLAAR